MYGPMGGGIPPTAAGGGVLASTGSPGLGIAAAVGTALVLVGVALLRRSRLAADRDEPGGRHRDDA
ncbi:hypothetical protein [Streptomyces sp. CBMA156]|uniref:hypothetical protein n=1 Tax=Streptomyces sp. CBMA156 TaxID=1930280 RepID=UPI001661F042|nr:hypothetical protein [Streptomyces sp. CBMA156]MBD0672430.1 hypothetical protein [Streptomyces sp. CBMA156]